MDECAADIRKSVNQRYRQQRKAQKSENSDEWKRYKALFSLLRSTKGGGWGGGGTPWDPLLDQPLLFMSNFSVLGELNTQTQSYFYWQTWFVLGDFYIGFHTINKQTSTYSLQHSIVVSINTSWTVWEVPGMFRTERVNKNVLNM